MTGCQSDTNYGYFTVNVTVADSATPEFLGRIASCGVNVSGDDTDFAPLTCPAGRVTTKQIGSFEWSTTATGKVHFVVNIQDIAANPLGSGDSGEVAIQPGSNVAATVVITPIPKELLPRM